MKVIAFYLPQYHETNENNEWWEPGFTEWTHMKRATSLADGHYQPRVPQNENYYDLLDVDVMRWQAKIAKENGVYGFCVYHYWFDGKLLLEKPMENYLNTPDIDFPYFFCWANDEWTNIWKGDSATHKTLIMNHYTDPKGWVDHFNYFLPFFRDERYMKEDGCPIVSIYNPVKIPYKSLKGMMKTWNRMAIENGFAGVKFTYQAANSFMTMGRRQRKLFDYGFEYLPPLISWNGKSKFYLFTRRIKMKLGQMIRSVNKSILDKNHNPLGTEQVGIKTVCDFDTEWEKALALTPRDNTIVPGAFTGWDNTPRYHHGGKVIFGEDPEKFRVFMERQIERAKNVYHKDAIMMFAWNEWSEGGYLEPDEKYGDAFLRAIKEALENTGEFPTYEKTDSVFYRE